MRLLLFNTPISDAIAGHMTLGRQAKTELTELTSGQELLVVVLVLACAYTLIGVLFFLIREFCEESIYEKTGVWLDYHIPGILLFAWPKYLVLDLKAILCAIAKNFFPGDDID